MGFKYLPQHLETLKSQKNNLLKPTTHKRARSCQSSKRKECKIEDKENKLIRTIPAHKISPYSIVFPVQIMQLALLIPQIDPVVAVESVVQAEKLEEGELEETEEVVGYRGEERIYSGQEHAYLN